MIDFTIRFETGKHAKFLKEISVLGDFGKREKVELNTTFLIDEQTPISDLNAINILYDMVVSVDNKDFMSVVIIPTLEDHNEVLD